MNKMYGMKRAASLPRLIAHLALMSFLVLGGILLSIQAVHAAGSEVISDSEASSENTAETGGQVKTLSANTDIYAMSDREVVDNAASLISDSEVIAWIAQKRSEITFTDEEFAAVAEMVRRGYELEQGYNLTSASEASDLGTMASSSAGGWTPGGAYSAGVGTYPVQREASFLLRQTGRPAAFPLAMLPL
jgi:hypothetical protein